MSEASVSNPFIVEQDLCGFKHDNHAQQSGRDQHQLLLSGGMVRAKSEWEVSRGASNDFRESHDTGPTTQLQTDSQALRARQCV